MTIDSYVIGAIGGLPSCIFVSLFNNIIPGRSLLQMKMDYAENATNSISRYFSDFI